MALLDGKTGLLPRLAVTSVQKNGMAYLPYIGVCTFAMFTYFVFGLILNSGVTKTLPRAAYATMLLMIGQILLGLIMIPFLTYTNSYLIKGRKKELGLYSVLGMEKKHIYRMMFYETVLIYLLVVAGAIALGLLFYRLLFLILLNLAGLPVNITFKISRTAVAETCAFAGIVMLIRLVINLYQVKKSNPLDIMGESGKGEKELRLTGVWSVLGLFAMGYGYWIALGAKMNKDIFTYFFVAVFLVMVGTHLLFTSGSIQMLHFLKGKPGIYYRRENFIIISGMLYRMKKNAAGLANICIFSTMVIITVVCTVSLYLGLPGLIRSRYPFLIQAQFLGTADSLDAFEALHEEAEALAARNGVAIPDYRGYKEGPDVFRIEMNPEGEETAVNDFSAQLEQLFAAKAGFASYIDNGEAILEDKSMYGGLLFVGIAFGMIFLICLLITMYYKQITEGFEDRKNFEVFKNVGMDDAEVRRTIRKQILLVFYLPLAGAFLHTMAGMHMVIILMGSIRFYERNLIIAAALGICVLFTLVYIFCYRRTARTYYRIVRR